MYKILFLIIFTCTLKAQDSLFIFPPVEITALRPVNNFQAFSILKEKDFESAEALSLEESFSKVPGIIINDRNNPSLGDKISIRGIGARSSFGVRGIKILADNIPLTFADGQSQTNNIDLYSAERVEILKGPVSSFYGNSAGGVINFQSMIPHTGVLNFSPEFSIGSFGFQKYSFKLSGSFHSHSYLLSFSNLNYSGFRDHSARKSFLLNSVYENRLTAKIRIKAVLNYFNSPYLLNPGSLDKTALDKDRSSVREFNKQQGTGEKSDQFQTGAILYLIDSGFSWETTLYFIKRNVLNPIPGTIIDLKRSAGGLRSFASKIFAGDNFHIGLNAGIDIEFQDDLRKEFENNGLPAVDLKPAEIFENLNYGAKLIDQKENVFSAAPFFSTEFVLDKTQGFLGGIRFDSYLFKVNDPYKNNSGRRNMSKFSPFAGIFFKPSVNSKIYFNYSTSFQTPTTSELSNRPDAEGGFNPDLKPESIYQVELGNELFINELNSSIYASAYYLNFSSLIVPYQVQNSEETYFRNAGKAENKGIEVMIESVISEDVKVDLSYSLMNFKYKDYIVEAAVNNYFQLEGNKVPGIPMQSFYFRVEFESQLGLDASVNFNWYDKYFANDFNGPPPGSSSPKENFINKDYLKTDLKLGYNFKLPLFKLEVFLGINNLFDMKYNGSVVQNAAGERFFEPAPGRNWYSGVHVDI
ncbi:MAG TPA: TonB-dependent receptor [Ignavibacteriaceae bacterium]|nr:TonB-dependent receptor [Ignavibacteriaceae bacterium]